MYSPARPAQPPEPWHRPTQILQRTLFPYPAEEALARASVSRDDIERWRELDWISFAVDALTTLDDPELSELLFIRNIARSGLSDEQIDTFLEELPKPYRYDPQRTAYNFAWGWVEAPAIPGTCHVDAFIEEHLSHWIAEKAEEGDSDRLHHLLSEVFEKLRPSASTNEDEE